MIRRWVRFVLANEGVPSPLIFGFDRCGREADTRAMSAGAYLNNQLLVAMPSLADPNFSHSVTLVCEHNERGALGLVINSPARDAHVRSARAAFASDL